MTDFSTWERANLECLAAELTARVQADADRPIIDQCPRCGRISLAWETSARRYECRHPGCGFACEIEDLKDRQRTRRELEWQACKDISSNDLLRFVEGGGMPGGRVIGYATQNGILHLYTDGEDFRARINSRDWGQAGWIEGIRWHPKEGGPADGS